MKKSKKHRSKWRGKIIFRVVTFTRLHSLKYALYKFPVVLMFSCLPGFKYVFYTICPLCTKGKVNVYKRMLKLVGIRLKLDSRCQSILRQHPPSLYIHNALLAICRYLLQTWSLAASLCFLATALWFLATALWFLALDFELLLKLYLTVEGHSMLTSLLLMPLENI